MSNKDFLNAMLELNKLALTAFSGLLFVIYGMVLQNVLILSEQNKEHLATFLPWLILAILILLGMYFWFSLQLKKEN